jgi:catechol 2,3-dioxygenase-like lactoylglutathione lyase family enzyme
VLLTSGPPRGLRLRWSPVRSPGRLGESESIMLSRSPVTASLPFRDLKKAKDFYTKKLGLKLVEGSIKDGYLAFAAGKGTEVHVFESGSTKSKDTAATFEVSNLEREMAALRKKKVVFEEYDLPGIKTVNGVATMGKHKGAWIKDPGGNILGLHQRA